MVGLGASCRCNPAQSRECLRRGSDQCVESRVLQRTAKPGCNGAFPATRVFLRLGGIRDFHVCFWTLSQPDAANPLATLADLGIWISGLANGPTTDCICLARPIIRISESPKISAFLRRS